VLLTKTPWGVRDVLLIHFLRLLVGYVTVRFIYPMLFAAPPPVVEITDRIVVVALVWFAVRRHGSCLADWGVTTKRWLASGASGIGAGMILLGVSVFSERLYTTVFLLSPTQHPLLIQVENALEWRDLMLPLFLAGVAAPVAEELLYRLYTFNALRERFGLWGGVVGSAAIFALFHFNAYWLAEMLVVGAGLAILYYRTGSLVSSIVAHSFVNTTKVVLVFLNIPMT